jgi:antitoxin component of RelBE/YafQ-DinJ toxin-antitoxin module
MATLSLRIRDDLKQKAERLAKEQGVSLNNLINTSVAAAVAQAETLRFFHDRLRDVDVEALHKRVLAFMSRSRSGQEPSPEVLREAMGGRF